MPIQAQLATQTIVDVESSMEEYLDRRDWRVNANANQGYSLGGLILNVAGKVTANYWLSHVYSPEAGRAHREGDLAEHGWIRIFDQAHRRAFLHELRLGHRVHAAGADAADILRQAEDAMPVGADQVGLDHELRHGRGIVRGDAENP